MKLIKGQYPIKEEDEKQEILYHIFGKRIELFDLSKDQICCGVVKSIGNQTFRFIDDTGGERSYNINDVEIRI